MPPGNTFFDQSPSPAGAAGFNASMQKNRARLAASSPLSIDAAQREQQSTKDALYAQHLQRATQLHYGGVNQAVTPPVPFAARHMGDAGMAGSALEHAFANPSFGTGGGSAGSLYAQNVAQQHPGLTGGTVAFGPEKGATFAAPGPLPPMAPSWTHSEQIAGKPRPPSLQGAGALAVSREPGHMAPPSGVAATAPAPNVAAMPQSPQVRALQPAAPPPLAARPPAFAPDMGVAAQPAPARRLDHWGTEIDGGALSPQQLAHPLPPAPVFPDARPRDQALSVVMPPPARSVNPAVPPAMASVQSPPAQGDPVLAGLDRQIKMAERTDPGLYGYLMSLRNEHLHTQSAMARGQAEIDETRAKLAAAQKTAGMDPFMIAELTNRDTIPSRLAELKAIHEGNQRVASTAPASRATSAAPAPMPAFDARLALANQVPGLDKLLGNEETGAGEVLSNMRAAGYGGQLQDPQSGFSQLLQAILQERAGTAGWKSEQHPWAESPGLNRTLNAMPFGLGSAAKSVYDWWQGPEALQASAWARGESLRPPAMAPVTPTVHPGGSWWDTLASWAGR